MTVTSVTSLLPPAIYGNAVIDMNTKYSGTGQDTASPLDDSQRDRETVTIVVES